MNGGFTMYQRFHVQLQEVDSQIAQNCVYKIQEISFLFRLRAMEFNYYQFTMVVKLIHPHQKHDLNQNESNLHSTK